MPAMSPLRRLLHYFGLHKPALTIGALCVVASAAFSLAKPLIVGSAVNELAKAVTRGELIRYGLLLVGAAALEGLFLFLQRRIVIGVSRHIEYEMRNDFYEHLQSLPVSYYQEQRTGDLISRATNDLAAVRMLIGPAVMHAISSLFVVIGAFVMMMRISHEMALLSLTSVPVIVYMVQHFGQRIHLKFKAVQDYFGDISARVQENLAGVRVVRAFGRERAEGETFAAMNREYVSRNRALIRLTATFYPALHAMIGLMFGVIFFLGSRKMIHGLMTIGSFVAFQLYLGRMVWPLIALGWVSNLFQRGMASMQRLHEVWSVAPEVLTTAGERVETPVRGEIEIRHLTFTYAGADRPTLRDINLHVQPGQTLGIVGRTGSGKSTLLALLMRTFEPPPGTIYIDGRPIESFPPTQLRQWIGAVPQETFLFSESIAENIRFGRREATIDEVNESAHLAGLSGDVATFPQGLETLIGERGITLSGGQKQRTAIARALVRDPAILILDDSLSAVDTSTEEQILRALREIRKGRTALIVSHRVSSVKDADAIIVIDDGRIVERGTHDTLLDRGGYYANLYRRQTLEEEIAEIA
ncbi:MAG: ATP-binding cassette, subfamily multidrug efflux pump [Thermoanaerobaculia bacterium]|jgi:ATP-binding cassette subfamily B protein|nr:ATP-binding cassette, subfamily multidrug efflux pump [Thermoanaerobaculia bacterium]